MSANSTSAQNRQWFHHNSGNIGNGSDGEPAFPRASFASRSNKNSSSSIGSQDSYSSIGSRESRYSRGSKDSCSTIGSSESHSSIGSRESRSSIGSRESRSSIGSQDSGYVSNGTASSNTFNSADKTGGLQLQGLTRKA